MTAFRKVHPKIPEITVKNIAYIATVLILLASTFACEKERIVESTEYIERIEYIQLPGDTVYQTDTIFNGDTIVQTVYDTITIVDTVQTTQCGPNIHLAMAAMQFNTDPLVLELIKQQFAIVGGWVLYTSNFQTAVTELSPGSFILVGVIDYWTLAWDQFYPLEFAWKLTHIGGDPANPQNWRMDEPNATGAPYHPGLRLKNSDQSVGSAN